MKFFSVPFAIIGLTMILNFASPVRVPTEPDSKTILQFLEWKVETTGAMARNDSTQRRNADTTLIDGTSIGSELSPAEVRQLIRLHNKVRADVGAGPVTWSINLASYAQEWANHLSSKKCRLEHRPHSGKWKQVHGENLFMGTVGAYGVADAVMSWEREKIYYRGQPLNASNWYDSGHYTQIVWKDSKTIGCAKAECNGNMIVVCNYDPPGNVLGEKPY